MTTLRPRYFTSTQMLKIVGSTRKTLRVLEAHGLIRPARSTGKRRYTQECLQRLWLIVLLRDVGIPLAKIGELLDTAQAAQSGGAAANKLLALLGATQKQIESKMHDLELARDALTTASRTLSAHCASCVRPTSVCSSCATRGRLDVVSVLLMTTAGRITDGTSGDS